MVTPRLSLWLSAVLHGALVVTLSVGGPTAAQRSRTPPPLVTIDCSDPEPPVDAPPTPCQSPPVQAEPLVADDVQLEAVAAEAPEPLLFAPAATPLVEPDDRTPPARLEATFASTRLRAAAPPPTAPVAAPSAVDPDAARVLSPLPGQNPPPEYPALARRRGWQGTVVVAITCDADGAVTMATVVRSSGHAVLDQAALTTVRRWRFAGGPAAGEQPIEFRLAAVVAGE